VRGFLEGEPSDLNPADIISLVLLFVSLAIEVVATDRGMTDLMIVAAVMSVPAGVLKVVSTRTKSIRWHRRHGTGMAAPRTDRAPDWREKSPAGRR
jgi:hypothetical protein